MTFLTTIISKVLLFFESAEMSLWNVSVAIKSCADRFYHSSELANFLLNTYFSVFSSRIFLFKAFFLGVSHFVSYSTQDIGKPKFRDKCFAFLMLAGGFILFVHVSKTFFILTKNTIKTAVINLFKNFNFKLNVSYACQHTFSKVWPIQFLKSIYTVQMGICMMADGCHLIIYENNAKILLRKCNFIFYFKFKPISNMKIERKFN